MAAGTGTGRPVIAVIISAILGLLASCGGAVALVSANAPNDDAAIQEGPAEVLDPATVLNYGG